MNDKNQKVPGSYNPSNDLAISGVVLGKQNDSITYTSKKTNQQVEASREIIIVQTSFGIVLCRSFSSELAAVKFAESLNVGDNVLLPVQSFAIDSGMKSASVRLI